MKISEIITDKYKLRIPPAVYYALLADVQEVEDEQEPTIKNDLDVDCIDRAELLKAVDTWDKFGCDANTKLVQYQDHYIPYIHYDDVIKCIKSMPSVTPQSRKGHWISTETKGVRYAFWCRYKCSLCGELSDHTNFCPNCGADMRGEKE